MSLGRCAIEQSKPRKPAVFVWYDDWTTDALSRSMSMMRTHLSSSCEDIDSESLRVSTVFVPRSRETCWLVLMT